MNKFSLYGPVIQTRMWNVAWGSSVFIQGEVLNLCLRCGGGQVEVGCSL